MDEYFNYLKLRKLMFSNQVEMFTRKIINIHVNILNNARVLIIDVLTPL